MTEQDHPVSLADISPEALNALSGDSFSDQIGLKFTELSPDRAAGELVVTPRLFQPHGIVHGGVYCAVIETLASVAAATWFGERGRVVGVNNNTDFLRATTEGTLRGVATPVHRGRSQQLWLVVLTDDQDRVVARGQVRLQNLTA